jgi:hypothetical protein
LMVSLDNWLTLPLGTFFPGNVMQFGAKVTAHSASGGLQKGGNSKRSSCRPDLDVPSCLLLLLEAPNTHSPFSFHSCSLAFERHFTFILITQP